MRRSPLSLVLLLLSACGGGSNAPDGVNAAGTDDTGAADRSGFNADAEPGDNDGGPAGTCASSTTAGTPVAPNVLFLFDTSESMIQAEGRWDKARRAVSSVLSAKAEDINVGIRFFPYPDNACTDDAFAVPQVPIGPIATTGTLINCWLGVGSCPGISAVSADGGTPMTRALNGAVKYMKGLTNEGARTIVLVTDGDPHACKESENIAGVIEGAKRAATGPGAKVTVWVIGAAGGNTSNLSRVAAAGEGKRTPTCVEVTTDPEKACNFTASDATLEKDLVDALAAITGKVRTCTFALPEGAAADPGKVNVSMSASTIPRDPAQMNGWDYDAGGKTITLYGSSCEQVRENPETPVSIVVGCKTKLL